MLPLQVSPNGTTCNGVAVWNYGRFELSMPGSIQRAAKTQLSSLNRFN